MKIHHLLAVGILGGGLLVGTAFAQNINTDTTSTTVGSTQFGTVLAPLDLQQVMQSTVALTCTGPVDARVCTPGAAQGTSTAFVRADQLPGSFTHSPTGTLSATPNFACGSLAVNSNDCQLTMTNINEALGDLQQTAPAFGVLGTARQLVGNINSNITIGDGGATAGMPDGFIAFTMDPATSDTTIDQFITHSIDLGGSLMVFNQRDATIGLGNTIPDPIGGTLTLLPFTSRNTQTLGAVVGGTQIPTNLVSRMTLAQGPADGFGGLNLDVSVNWQGELTTIEEITNLPFSGTFVTPGLNTGINPQPIFGVQFPAEFNNFAFP